MTALNTYISRNIRPEIRSNRDFESGRGWADLANELLQRLESEKLFNITRVWERGIEIRDGYWVDNVPSDLRTVLKIYDPLWPQRDTYSHEHINDQIKLHDWFDKDSSPDTFTLSSGSTTGISINDADATADLWNDYLLILTDGTYSGDGIMISDTAAAAGGVSALTFLHTQPASIDSTAGYLTLTFLMLKYRTTFTTMSTYNGEIPVDDRYEYIFKNWFNYQNVPRRDPRYELYKKDFEEDWKRLVKEHATPTDDQARSDPVIWPTVDINESPTHTWTGD